jgi:hypothetical protein
MSNLGDTIMRTMNLLLLACVYALIGVESKAATVVSNLGSEAASYELSLSPIFSWGVEFITDNRSYVLNSVTLDIYDVWEAGPLSVQIYNNLNGNPGDLLNNGSLSGISPVGPGDVTYNSTATLLLTPSTSYFLVIRSGGVMALPCALHSATGTWEVPQLVDENYVTIGWEGLSAGSVPMFAIDASPITIPEPSVMALWTTAMAILGVRWVRSRRTV